MTRVAGALTKSGEVMKLVNSLMRVPQLSRTMAEMSRGEGVGGWGVGGGRRTLGQLSSRLPTALSARCMSHCQAASGASEGEWGRHCVPGF